MKQRLLNLLIAIDQLVYVVLTLGIGQPDETLSAAAWRTEQTGKLGGRIFRPLIDLLFLPLERAHCRKAYESECLGHQLPDEYRMIIPISKSRTNNASEKIGITIMEKINARRKST